MTPHSSPSSAPLSPLAFTLAYQQYRSEAARIPFADTRLLKAAHFWTANAAALDNPTFSTYRLEDIPPLLATLNPDQLDDLRPMELEEVAEFVERAGQIVSPSPPKVPPSSDSEQIAEAIPSPSATIWELAAEQWLYVGGLSRALAALERSGHSASIASDVLASILADCDPCDATEIPGVLAARLDSLSPTAARWLRDFNAAWTAQREAGDANRAACLLVEYDANGSPVRGRLRRLEGKVDALNRDADSDEVTFHHQVKSPDDPFVGTVYAAFDALRRAENRRAPIVPTGPRYRGRFAFDRDGGETYSGDSIGLSAFAVAFGDQWGHEVHRERRLIGQTVAFTGGIGAEGSVQPVSPDSLPLKVERAFHSPITHLVVPEANRKTAEAEVARLRQAHPRRRLHIIGIERPADIIADHNIFHTEKLWPGEFAIRKAAKYSRSVKVQVPVLVVLGYLLFCLIYPKAWIGFDRDPRSLRLTGRGFVAQNTDGDRLWEKHFETDCDTLRSLGTVEDLDGDGHAEVAYLLNTSQQRLSDLIGTLFLYDHNGTELFRRRCSIENEYPGDTSSPQQYTVNGLAIIRMRGRPLIMTSVVNSYPARTHIRFWTAQGAPLGWYINAGYAAGTHLWFIPPERDVMYGAGINNRVGAACLFAVSPDSSCGVSPPYSDPEFDLTRVRRGNQLHYLVFPPTALCRSRAIYNSVSGVVAETGGLMRVDVDEFGGQRATKDSTAPISYYLDRDCRVLEARCTDNFRAAWDYQAARGGLPAVDWDTYPGRLTGNVTHWTDSGWVTEAQLRAAAAAR